jgi:TP901 family phage tail tape measure protein
MSLISTIRAGAAYVEVTAETSKLQRNLRNAQNQLQAFGSACSNVGKNLLMLSGVLATPLVIATKSFAGFDDSMRLVQAVTQATDKDFQSLTVTAQKLGRETSYTAKQAADAMVSLGRMGFNPNQIEKAIGATLNLARATGTELAQAGDIAANSMRIFGLEAEKMADVSDVLTVTANSSAQTLVDLFEALKMGGPQAAAAGETLRETSAAIAVLANMGIKGSLAGTALRKSFSQFSSIKIQEKLRAVGVETLESNGNLRKMADIMKDIAKVLQTMPTAERLSFAEDIFDIRGSLAGLTLTANTSELDAMMLKLLDVEGVAANTAQKMDAGIGGSFRLLASAAEGALNAIASAMNSTLQPVVQNITNVINLLTKWIEKNSALVTSFAVIIAGSALLGAGLIGLGVAAKGVAAGLTVLKTATQGWLFIQGAGVALCSQLTQSISLVGQAFNNYQNLSMPALVGTEKLLAAFALTSTSANRARAEILLMSNAQAAAAAKDVLTTQLQSLATTLQVVKTNLLTNVAALKAHSLAILTNCKNSVISFFINAASAIRGMTLATVASTIATKAHSVATNIATAATATWNAVQKVGIVVTTAFTAASVKAALAITASSAATLILATAAKIASAAMLALSGIMTVISAHPLLFSLVALTGIFAGLCAILSKGASYTANLSNTASTLREKNNELRKTDELRMERLKQLSSKQRLSNVEMKEAELLASKLEAKYGNLGITLNNAASKFAKVGNAAKEIKDAKVNLKVKVEDLPKFDQLAELSLVTKLDTSQLEQSKTIIDNLSSKYGNLNVAIDETTQSIRVLSSEQQKINNASIVIKQSKDPNKEVHLAQLEHLKALSLQEKLNAQEQLEASNIVETLNSAYGSLGVNLDKLANKLNLATNAQKKLNDLMKLASIGEIDSEIAELKHNIQELRKENAALDSYWNHTMFASMTGKQAAANSKSESNANQMVVMQQKISSLKIKKQALLQPSEPLDNPETTKANVERSRVQLAQARSDAQAAEKKVADIERSLRREKQSELANEIEDIIALRDEYKELIKTMLAFENAKSSSEKDQKKIAELEKKLANANKTAEERISAAKEKEKQKLASEVANYQRNFSNTEKDFAEKRALKQQDLEIENTLATNPKAGKEKLQALIEQYKLNATIAKRQFQFELSNAQNDGSIDDKEKLVLENLHSAFSKAESMVDRYTEKLRLAQEGTSNAKDRQEKVQLAGSFFAKDLAGLLGGSSNAAERTANATEKSNQLQQKTNTTLATLVNKQALTY